MVRAVVDGHVIPPLEIVFDRDNLQGGAHSMQFVASVPAGQHTVKIQYKVGSASGSLFGLSDRTLTGSALEGLVEGGPAGYPIELDRRLGQAAASSGSVASGTASTSLARGIGSAYRAAVSCASSIEAYCSGVRPNKYWRIYA